MKKTIDGFKTLFFENNKRVLIKNDVDLERFLSKGISGSITYSPTRIKCNNYKYEGRTNLIRLQLTASVVSVTDRKSVDVDINLLKRLNLYVENDDETIDNNNNINEAKALMEGSDDE